MITKNIENLDDLSGINRFLGYNIKSNNIFIISAKKHVPARQITIHNVNTYQKKLLRTFPDLSFTCTPEEILIGPHDQQFSVLHWKMLGSQKKNLVIMIHGGPHLQYFKTCTPDVATLLEHEIDVLQINYHSSSGYGQKFKGESHLAKSDIRHSFEYAKNP